ncbi:MAG: aminotransferase class I/II-fold pyridoxal phosphate-dependent enzyme [Lachnospiraceae bacterium]|nr:aminotransferase class I/II-fold pyridoxal phosphate-dependent enzyme [Lachnospiraceae bacterium]
MIAEAEKWIAEQGIAHVVISSQDRAQGFYEKCGYVYNPDVSPNEYDVHRRPKPTIKRPIGFKPDFVCVLVEKYLDPKQFGDQWGIRPRESETQKNLGFATKCIHGDGEKAFSDPTGAISTPIYQSATFVHPEVGKSTGYDYSRLQNPTRAQLERVVASLEGGADALAFTSGMAAITALLELFRPGDHLITEADLYGGTIRLFHHVCEKNGITFSHVDCGKENIEEYIKENTKAIYLETPTNPMMKLTDIRKVAEVAKRHGLLLIVDNTFLSPYFQRPLTLGADIVIHSGTKFLGGHNDTLAGFIVVKSEKLAERLRFLVKTVGSGLAPFDSWLILRGIKTLPIRLEKAQKNAQAIAAWLQRNPKVTKVYYPGIPGTEGYEVCKSQASGFGSMLTFEVESKELALHVLKQTKLIPFAESLGGTETLLTYPITQTHADVPEAERLANGITDRVLRLSAGIEDEKDLIADLEQAFSSFGA